MPDITMCENGHFCDKSLNCYRYMAHPTPYHQSYASFYEYDRECSYFWSLWWEDENSVDNQKKT